LGLLDTLSMRFYSPLFRWGPGGVHGRHALCGIHGPLAALSELQSPTALFRAAVCGLWVGAILALGSSSLTAQQPGRSGAWAIESTTVLDGRGGPALTDAVVIVDRGVIRCVGSRNRCPLFGITSVIDGSDLWVMPGLIDPDVRMPWTVDSLVVQDAQHVRLAVGITLVRESGTAGEVESNLRARKRASDPFRPEPKILVTGAVEPRTARELGASGLVDTARRLARSSVDGLRVTGQEPDVQLDSIFRIAKSWSIPVYGSAPGERLNDDQVVALAERGVRVVGAPAAVVAGSSATLDSLVERSVALDAALASVRNAGTSAPHLENLRFLEGPRPVAAMIPFVSSSAERELARARKDAGGEYARAVGALQRFREHGGRLVASSGEARPGSGLLAELELLQEAGLDAGELLSLATYSAARALGVERRYGSVRPGLAADLLLLEADPTADIRNTKQIWRVVKSGVIYDPIQLLEPYRLRYERQTRNAWKQRAVGSKWVLLAGVLGAGFFWYRRKNAWRL